LLSNTDSTLVYDALGLLLSMANKIDPVADNNFDPLKVKYCVL